MSPRMKLTSWRPLAFCSSILLLLILLIRPSLCQQEHNLTSIQTRNLESISNQLKHLKPPPPINNNNNNPQTNQTKTSIPTKPSIASQQRELLHYKTTYACEGNQLDLNCQEGKLIHLVRANYGRFSLSICNEWGHSNLSVQCFAFRAFLVMETRCNKLSNCSVLASKEIFGDPCEGTSKYLEVQYYCDDAAANNLRTNTLLPPQQVAARPNSTTTNNQDTPNQIHVGHKSPASSSSQQQVVATLGQQFNYESTTPAEPNTGDLEPTDLSNRFVPQQDSVIQQQQSGVLFCPGQVSARNLYWNATRAGQLARQPCPEGSSGKASWLCEPERARFSPAWSPDFSQCRSNWLHRLGQQLEQMLEAPQRAQNSAASQLQLRQQNEDTLKSVLNDLVLMARSKELFSEDLKRIDIMIGQIIAQLKSVSSAGDAWTRQAPLYEELFSQLATIVSSLFELSQRNAWLELQPADLRRRLELRLLQNLKEAALLLASQSPANELDQQRAWRQSNLFAGLAVIGLPGRQPELDLDYDLQQSRSLQSSLSNFVTNNDELVAEFKLPAPVLRELAYRGVTRLFVLDVRKPDYAMLRQQMELSSQDAEANNLFAGELSSSGSTSKRIFGVFALLDNGQVLDSRSALDGGKLAELLAEWPLTVDFKLAPQGQQVRQCSSLADALTLQPNRCHTFKANTTNHVCRCDQLGWLALAGAVQSPAPSQMLEGFQWPTGEPSDPLLRFDPNQLAAQNKQQQPALGVWMTVFVVMGLSLLLVSLAALIVNVALRASAQSRLSKKQGFLTPGGSMLSPHRGGGPTTGPLAADHGLMSAEPVGQLHPTATTHSTSIIGGLNQAACHSYTKAQQQQLYAAHLASSSGSYDSAPAGRFTRLLARLLRPAGWLAAPLMSKADPQHQGIISHRVVGYKSPYQNGYTTSLHQTVGQQLPASSTSSYVSSSAYYEEIGPGNLTKVNSSQLASSRPTHTIVDPFKQRPPVSDQQQLLHSTNQHQLWSQPAPQPSTGLSYTMEAQPNQTLYGPAVHRQLQLHNPANNDLNHLQSQSSSSSAGSQHSASTNLTSANGSTPRHYLFASPNAVSAYKSSMSQHSLHHHQHHPPHQQQQQQRFMQG